MANRRRVSLVEKERRLFVVACLGAMRSQIANQPGKGYVARAKRLAPEPDAVVEPYLQTEYGNAHSAADEEESAELLRARPGAEPGRMRSAGREALHDRCGLSHPVTRCFRGVTNGVENATERCQRVRCVVV